MNELSPGKRPQLLTVLSILSFIGSGLSSVSNLFVFLNHDLLIETITSGVFDDMGFDLGILTDTNTSYFLLMGLLNIVSFTGVRQMWSLRKTGFHIYSISQLLMLIVSTVYVYKPSGVFPMFDLVFTAFFILFFLRFRDIMD